jgi:type VI protein secretion system component VasK
MLEQITTIADLGSMIFAVLGLFYARPSAPGKELWAAAAMLLFAAAGQIVALCADIFGSAGWQRLVSNVLAMTFLLIGAWITWGRADRADELAGDDTEGDLW